MTKMQKAKTSKAYTQSKTTFGGPEPIKTSPFGSLTKTALQAKSRVKSIYGTGNSQGLQKIAASQQKYAAATNAQKSAVETKKKEAEKALVKFQAKTLDAAALGSRKKSRVTEYFYQRGIRKQREKLGSNLSKEEAILKTLEAKKKSYNAKAAEQIAKISKSKIGSQINMSKQTSLATAMEAAKQQYKKTIDAPLQQKQAQFEAAKAKKTQINSGVITTKKALTVAEATLATAKASPYAKTQEGINKITEAQTKLVAAQNAFTDASKLLKTHEYTISAQQVQTIGKKLSKTKKIDLISVDKLNRVAKGDKNTRAKANAEVGAIRSSIQINRKTAKYGALNKLLKYTKPELQTEMIARIKKGSSPGASQDEQKKAIKYQAILGILQKEGLLSETQETAFEIVKKVQTEALSPLTPEQKRIAGLKLNSNIKTAKADAAAAAAKAPGALKTFFRPKAAEAQNAAATEAQPAALKAQNDAIIAKTKANEAFNASNAGKIAKRQANEATLAAAQKTLATEKEKKVSVIGARFRPEALTTAQSEKDGKILTADTAVQTAQAAVDISLAAAPKKTVADLTPAPALVPAPVGRVAPKTAGTASPSPLVTRAPASTTSGVVVARRSPSPVTQPALVSRAPGTAPVEASSLLVPRGLGPSARPLTRPSAEAEPRRRTLIRSTTSTTKNQLRLGPNEA